jgi:hypothetical protein
MDVDDPVALGLQGWIPVGDGAYRGSMMSVRNPRHGFRIEFMLFRVGIPIGGSRIVVIP